MTMFNCLGYNIRRFILNQKSKHLSLELNHANNRLEYVKENVKFAQEELDVIMQRIMENNSKINNLDI